MSNDCFRPGRPTNNIINIVEHFFNTAWTSVESLPFGSSPYRRCRVIVPDELINREPTKSNVGIVCLLHSFCYRLLLLQNNIKSLSEALLQRGYEIVNAVVNFILRRFKHEIHWTNRLSSKHQQIHRIIARSLTSRYAINENANWQNFCRILLIIGS
jgi:hypothetical protein